MLVKNFKNDLQERFGSFSITLARNRSESLIKSNRNWDFEKVGLKNWLFRLFFHPDKRIVIHGVFYWAFNEFDHCDDRLDAKFVRSDAKSNLTDIGKIRGFRGRALQRAPTPPKHRFEAFESSRRRWLG